MHTTTGARRSREGVRQEAIEGGFVHITVHQIAMAWWLMRAGHITRRQMRIYFAAFELRERRRHARDDSTPRYKPEEIRRLAGGGEVGADLAHLRRIGLLAFGENAVEPAVSIDQIAVADVSGFWAMFEAIENRRRSIPVPRRTLRALAGGFGRAATAVMLAILIRGMYWHRESGDYRIDGRVKASWIMDVFGISRRAVTGGVATLTRLGWIERLKCSQWELNKYGLRLKINTGWKPAAAGEVASHAVGEGGPAELRGFPPGASVHDSPPKPRSDLPPPVPESAAGFATPIKQVCFPPGIKIKTRKPTEQPAAPPPGSPGFSGVFQTESKGSREKSRAAKARREAALRPNIRDIRPESMQSTADLLELYRQACAAGLARPGEAGRLDFLAMAERARAHGQRPGALFMWLLRGSKTAFITQADEDAAVQRLRELRDGPREILPAGGRRPVMPELTDDERFVQACIRAANATRFEPHVLAREGRGWSRERWDQALDGYNTRQYERMSSARI